MIKNIIFDFDGTLINDQGIDLLIKAALARTDAQQRQKQTKECNRLRNQVWSGDLSLGQALRQIFMTVKITRETIAEAAKDILKALNPMVQETIQALQTSGKNIFVFSNAFDEIVKPVTDVLGIPYENVFSNHLLYDDNGKVIGADESNPLILSTGKVYLAERLRINGKIKGKTAVVGDGSTDLSIRKTNVAKMFVYFAGSHMREDIRKEADFFVDRFDQLLSLFCSNTELEHNQVTKFNPAHHIKTHEIEYSPIKISLFENIHPRAVDVLRSENFDVEIQSGALSIKDHPKNLLETQVLGIRSKSKIDAKMISQFPELLAIGAYCIGTDQINLVAAANAGIPVFNAPYSNTRSVAELVVGEVIMLMRRTFEKSSAAQWGHWLKSAKGCAEIRGKIVGIVGYGHIGTQVSVMLESLGMHVVFHDIIDKLPLGNAMRAKNLNDLLSISDIVTLHVPDTPETRGMISTNEIAAMKKGSFLINTSRGTVVDLEALKQTLQEEHLAGAAIDVFPNEPGNPEDQFQCPLQEVPNVILTPHIGGSTLEAQENIGLEVSGKIIKFLKTGTTIGAINFPELELPRVEGTHRILHIHSNIPGVLAKINSVFGRRSINVEGQILQTKGNIGYLIVDVNRNVSEQVLELMGTISETIRVRRIA